MPVGLGESNQRRAGHQKVFQHAALDQRHALRGNAFVVIAVMSQQNFRAAPRSRGIVVNRKERREDFLADLAREGLPLIDVLLAMALGAVAEYFMEEHRRR